MHTRLGAHDRNFVIKKNKAQSSKPAPLKQDNVQDSAQKNPKNKQTKNHSEGKSIYRF